ncbi:MAG: hypothetical protein AAGA85_19875 [Bacteroidota bacterium]
MRTSSLILFLWLLVSCQRETIFSKFARLPVATDLERANVQLFERGAYVYKVASDTSRLLERSSRASSTKLAAGVKNLHIASSIWFLDSVRFVQLSDYYLVTDTEINPYLPFFSRYRRGTYHMGTYGMKGDELELDYQDGNNAERRRFKIFAKVNGDSLVFTRFENVDLHSDNLADTINLETLFPDQQAYVFDNIPKIIELYPSFFLEHIDIGTNPVTYKIHQKRDEKGNPLSLESILDRR